jgi:hypothetical protein
VEHCSGSILIEEEDVKWGEDDGKWKRAMPLSSLSLESETHTPVSLMAISLVSRAIFKQLCPQVMLPTK